MKTSSMEKNPIKVGDRFYYNNYCVSKKLTLPDYYVVTKIKNGFVTAKPEAHHIDTKERVYSEINLWIDSTLNEKRKNPGWVFVRKV